MLAVCSCSRSCHCRGRSWLPLGLFFQQKYSAHSHHVGHIEMVSWGNESLGFCVVASSELAGYEPDSPGRDGLST